MDHLPKLVTRAARFFSLLFVFLVSVVPSAHASGTVPAITSECWYYSAEPNPSGACYSPADMAERWKDFRCNPGFYSGETITSCTGSVLSLAATSGTVRAVINTTYNGSPLTRNYDTGISLKTTQGTCPENSGNLSGGNCTCNTGYTASNGVCVPECPAPGTVVMSGYVPQGSDPQRMNTLACSGACEVVFDGVSGAGSTTTGGVRTYYALGEWLSTGNQCSGSTPPAGGATPSIPAPSCPDGQVMGTINGQTVCHEPGTDGEAPRPESSEHEETETTTTDNGDGTTTTTTTGTRSQTHPDGSTGTQTTTTTTTCDAAGNCESTTDVEEEGNYREPGEEGEEEDEESECDRNPDLAACAELDTPEGPQTPTSSVNVAGISAQGGWGSDNGSCPASVSTLSIGSVDVFGLMCTYMQGIRFAVIGVAWLIAALIFLGRVD